MKCTERECPFPLHEFGFCLYHLRWQEMPCSLMWTGISPEFYGGVRVFGPGTRDWRAAKQYQREYYQRHRTEKREQNAAYRVAHAPALAEYARLRWHGMTPRQRAAYRQARRERFRALSEEEKQRRRAAQAAASARWRARQVGRS